MIARKAVLIILVKATTSILTFVGLIFITRYIGSDEYGLIAWALAYTAAFSAISDLGFGTAHIKKMSEEPDIKGCISTYIFIKIFLTIVMALIILISIAVWVIIFGNTISNRALALIMIFTLYQMLYSFSSIVTTTYQARMQIAKSQIILLIDPLVRTPLIILLSIESKDALAISLVYLSGAMMVFIASMFQFNREGIVLTKPRLIKQYVEFALPISFVSISIALTANLDTILIGIFWPSSDVAYYSVSLTIMAMFSIIGIAVSTITLPNFSALVRAKKFEQIDNQIIISEKYILLAMLPIVALFLIYPNDIAKIIFGSKFEQSGTAMRFLIISTLFVLLYQAMSMRIIADNKPSIYAKINIISLIIKIMLLVILIPKTLLGMCLIGLSYEGAAIASAISSMFFLILTQENVHNLRIKRIRTYIKYIIPMTMTTLTLFLLNDAFPINNSLEIIMPIVISFSIFYISSYITKGLTISDIRFIFEMSNPYKMISYILSELKEER